MRKLFLTDFNPVADVLNLFFPRLCLACNGALPPRVYHVCADCQLQLPYTRQHLEAENAFKKRLVGRVPLVQGSAMFFFDADSFVENLIYGIKYENKPDAAVEIGRWYGLMLKKTSNYDDVTAILPVPMHRKKQIQRGFNQAERFGEGLAQSMGLYVDDNLLQKTRLTESQTKKNKKERLENAQEVYAVTLPPNLPNAPHFLIVDDVLTTGATLEACADALRAAIPNVRISMATIGIRA